MQRIFSGPIRSIRATSRTAIFFLKVLPMLPSRPVNWVTSAPVVTQVRYPTSSGEASGDLYRPAGNGPHPGIVACLGVVPFGVDHPQVPRLGDALARAGFATLMYWSPAMRDLRLDPDDVEGIALAYRWLIQRSDIDAARSGLLGTCVGGSFALMAAAQRSIRDQVAFVIAWAPYSSMRTLARDIASATTRRDGLLTPWAVDQLTRKVFVRSLTSTLDPGEAARLRDACAERKDAGTIDQPWSPEGRSIFPLLTALDPVSAVDALDRLPPDLRARLDAMSPLTCVREIHAPMLHLAHDRDDAVIPIRESQALVAALSGRAGVRYTEFMMFKHLDPTKVRLPLLAFARELIKFLGTVYPLFWQSVQPSPADSVTAASPAAHNAPLDA